MHRDHYTRAEHAGTHRKKRTELPNTKVLVLAAVCIAIIAVILAYKVSEAEQQKLQLLGGGTLSAGVPDTETSSDARIADALSQAQSDSLGLLASTTNPFDPSPKDNISDTFSKDLFRSFAQGQSTGTDIPNDEISANAINDIKTDGLPQNKYTLGQLTIFNPANSSDVHQYGNTFATAYLSAVQPIKDNPDLYSSSIDALAVLYKNVASNLMKVKVPSAVAEDQLQLANDFSMMSEAFGLVDGQQKDPVKALLGLRVIQDSMKSQVQVFTDIKSYFGQNDILFTADEPGNIWNQAAPDPSVLQSSDNTTTNGN